MIAIGLDPGFSSGGIVILRPEEPSQAIRLSKATVKEMVEFVRRWGDPLCADQEVHQVHAVLEKVHAMPKQGVSSSFKFGQGYGRMEAMLYARGIPFDYATPQTWQRAMGVASDLKGKGGPAKKRVLAEAAQRLFPGANIAREIADAYLIAEFCRRTYAHNRLEGPFRPREGVKIPF